MCGIAGSLYFKSEYLDKNISRKMISKLTHRGPDNLGEWESKKDGIIFNHSRLMLIMS